MRENSGDGFNRRNYNQSSEWTVIVIATIITALLIFGYMNYAKNPSILEQEPVQNSQPESVANPLTPTPEKSIRITEPTTAAPNQIYKCVSNGKALYSETPCATPSETQGLDLVDNKSDGLSQNQIKRINDQSKVVMLEAKTGTGYMSDRDIQNRIKELEVSINSINSSIENKNASTIELGYMRRHPRQLGQSDEIRRSNLRRDLERLDDNARYKALIALQAEIFSKY